MTLTQSQQKKIIRSAAAWVKKRLGSQESGHDWDHIQRVRSMALHIATNEKADLFLVELMALLHEVHDWKIVGIDAEKTTLQEIQQWLKKQQIPAATIETVIYTITHQSYSVSGLNGEKLPSLEGCIVQDADRLEAIGAIGIARVFTFGGRTNRPIYDPLLKPPRRITTNKYRKSKTPSVNHFYEKLLKIAALMNTPTAKKLARRRHRFMQNYLTQFHAEWKGER
jgi:uncharacterized protein